ncbi:bifunctional helix-turn-helix transcriptional regulator/GNAT family N-acetyltransferase [Thermasporomyces composti]|jgi:DNA-binding MarR family transcriptional regulator/GNAT superfamily N-acetyltransferase|uniref:MarR family transcriptional regulator with acetyltransferase activity n=1 Tax=Thermasporomyces composti TaxID=696763 RepID=A0A3D9V9M9_THECX|nr:helix-turn-helix domain-containing GNAT family N-acetyltransferase [Thermasporomyces composti]REF37403.1 MarR family transcriptional regulator with acetyltransferase activity [Thermasporomyces composti]
MSVVDRVREFNRFYTNVIGLLGAGLLKTPYSLTEARVLFELGTRGTVSTSTLREVLGLDPGYLSRILAKFAEEGLITRERSSEDARRQIVTLTDKGRDAFQTLDARSAADIETMLTPLTPAQRERLVASMGTIRELLEPKGAPRSYVIRPPRPGDYGWVVWRHGTLYSEEYGWGTAFEGMVARIVADYLEHHDPRREAAWIAEFAGEPVGCVFCVRKDDETAQLRLLLVEPAARGMGIGRRLVDECLDFARRAGYRRMTLDTRNVLVSARRIYDAAGFRLVEEHPAEDNGRPVVEQVLTREL